MKKFTNGDVYKGNFHKGVASGHGRYNFSNGDWYEGMFRNDNINGDGTYFTHRSVKELKDMINHFKSTKTKSDYSNSGDNDDIDNDNNENLLPITLPASEVKRAQMLLQRCVHI